eukprot:COSAG06_NODE_2246_length_7262_cov_6.923775_5_plen_63_part_01
MPVLVNVYPSGGLIPSCHYLQQPRVADGRRGGSNQRASPLVHQPAAAAAFFTKTTESVAQSPF